MLFYGDYSLVFLRYFNKSGVRLHALPGVSFNISDRLTRLKLDVEHNPLSQACQNLWLETLKASNSAADSKASGASLRPHDASCAPPQIELSANYSAALEAVVVQCTSPGQPLLEVSWSVAPSSLRLDQYSEGRILVTKSRQAPLCSFQNITCRARNDFAVVTKTISWTSLCRSNKDQKAAIHSMTQSSYKIIMNFSSPHPEFCSCWSFRRCSRTSERPCSKAKVYHITGSNFLQNDGYLYCKQMYHGWFKFAVRSESEEVSKVLQIGDLSACKSPSDFEVINTIHVLKIKSASSVTESPQWDVDHHTQQDEEASEEPEAHTPLLEVVLPLVMVVLLLALLPCVSWVLRQPRTQRWRTCQRRVPACKTAAGKVSYFLNSRLPGSRVVFSRDEASSGEGSAGRLLTLGVIIIPNESLKFEHALGEGAFGTVYYGTMEIPDSDEPLPVALKTLHAGGEYISQEVEREAATLSSLTHPNIVAFHGLCYDSSPMVMVFEYMEHGDLNNFLREHNREAGVAEELKPPLSVMDDLQIALQVAAGMTYLASQHYVHRDLAARNCLVGANMIVKIGDFGMSRDIYMSDYYTFGCQTMLPIRWMPPESILYRRFTVDSDVWSFGVLLWEVFTGGQQPWYGYSNQEVITKITACLMLPCPEKCPDDLYAIMKKCWSKNPSERPSMAAIHQSILSLTKLDNCIHIGSLE
ncbi:Serine-threonine/tyrosine-protein kinase catalytic domain [Trinorchestia longiramus]|nr:Serine-threonine/tyrosine-protein kinase catalytic domain [Trinorchestia longiramus]